jgi:glycosyltransferase involved in cell wall biosynthesis
VNAQNPDYSFVIPAFNESARLPATLDAVFECIRRHGWNAEVIVVNDGSTDDTAALVRERAKTEPTLKLLENPGNRGKGYSVRHGMLAATGKVLLFTDSDMSSPIGEAVKLFDAIKSGYDVAIGSRWLDGRSGQTQPQPLYRQFFGRCFNLTTRMIMRLPFADTQCGFKAFTHEAAQEIFSRQTIERWGFDPEIMFIAIKRGYKVKEMTVQWAHDERTRMSYLRDGMQMLRELMTIRWNAMRGRYSKGK